MASIARLKELTEVLREGAEEPVSQAALDEIIGSLPAVSGKKALRDHSTEVLTLIPCEKSAAALSELANSKRRLHVSDLVLALRWTDAVLSTAAVKGSECLSSLLVTQGTLITRSVTALSNSTKSHRASERLRKGILHHSHMALTKVQLPADSVVQLLSGHGANGLNIQAQFIAAASESDRPSVGMQLGALENSIMQLWCTVVLNAKSQEFNEIISPLLNSEVYDPFWSNGFVQQGTLDTVIAPALQKALLRAPEGVVTAVIPSMVRNSSLVFDSIASSPSLVSSLTSSNPVLRQATASAFSSILRKTQDPQIDGLISQFAKVTNSDSRVLFATVLNSAPESKSEKVSKALAAQAPREGSEHGVRAIADALDSRLPEEAAVSAFKKGLVDQRKPLRREWICALSESHTTLFKEDLNKAWEEISSNVGAATTAKFAVAGFKLVLLLNPAEVPEQLFAARVYEHLNSESEVFMCAAAASKLLVERQAYYAIDVLVYLAVHGSVAQRRYSLDLITAASKQPDLPAEFFLELKRALEARVEKENVDVSDALTAVPVRPWLIVAFELAHRKLAKPAGGWIRMCLHANVDPNSLVKEFDQRLFNEATMARSVEAVATLAFVAPEVISERIVGFLHDNLQSQKLSERDDLILSTPEGQLVTASTADSRRNARNKGNSDEAWEAEMRKELAKKHGKLTDEEQAQLAEQSERRKVLMAEKNRVEFCCSLLTQLAQEAAAGAENGSLQWSPEGLHLCLGITKDRVGREAATECLSSLNVTLSDRFKGHWKIVTSKLLLQGDKVDVGAVRDMLYMLNPLSDKRLLDAPSLVYILPVLRSVLANYSGEKEDETADEAVLLVTSLLANQAEVLVRIPRGDLVGVLLQLIAKFAADRSAIKDCLRSVAQRVEFDDDELRTLLDASVGAPQDFVRQAALEVVDAEVDLEGQEFSPEIWIARFSEFGDTAQDIWSESNMRLPTDALLSLKPYFAEKYMCERDALAAAFAAASLALKQVEDAYKLLEAHYIAVKQPPKPIFNSFGIEIKQKWKDPVEERLSVLTAFEKLVPHLAESQVLACANFIVTEGVTDTASQASAAALELGKKLIDTHGAQYVDGLLPQFEDQHVILYGFEAQHLPANDERLKQTVDRLLAALPEASEQVLLVITSCLGPLASRIDFQQVIERTFEEVFTGPTRAARRGAAYGFAGFASGVGLSVLGDVDIVSTIAANVEDRKNSDRRAGAEQLVSALAHVMGRHFEPYALELMPQVLIGLGDLNAEVRELANEAARRIMANTTAFGIKRQIPLALDRLDQTAWRGKKGAVELLGSMAYLDPKQLATSLATIVPEIVALLNDTHKEVRASAKASMKMFGEVIQNPEVHKLVPTLLAAISDPTTKTDGALTDLLKTRFMHYIDSPSLALIIFVVQRGLRDRSAATRRKACQIVGNMSILTAGRDIVPYLPRILPDLQAAMTDPVPQTCAVACKALGVLVEKLGEEYFPSVIPDMIAGLQSDEPGATGNRWGTAQGLAEVLHGLGTAKLEEMLPEIVANCQSPKPHIRQGFIPLLLLLPGSFGSSLTPYLPQLIQPLLRGLADSLDDVRENALKAGRRIVRGYATVAVDLLLPELERGLWDPSWRIRLASVELVGDLLMQLLGKGPANSEADRLNALAEAPSMGSDAESESEDEEGTSKEPATPAPEDQPKDDKATSGYVESSLRQLEVLGSGRRDRVLAAIFICRADVVPTVRQAALDTWLSLIQNTPKAVKMILPTLVLMLVKRLSDDDDELQTNAARALAELVRRVSSALEHIMPTFMRLLPDRDARQGICLGLVELIPATPVTSLQEHERDLMHLVRTCLQDSSDIVREAATRALEGLHAELGDVAGDILPEMVQQVASESDAGALAALKEMLSSAGAKSVLAVALPPLLEHQDGLDEFRSDAIAELCVAAGPAETRMYAGAIVDKLIRTPYASALDAVLRVTCPESHLLTLAKSDEQVRANVFARMATYYRAVAEGSATHPAQDMMFVSDWVVFALHGLEQPSVASAAEDLLQTFSSTLSKNQLAQLSSSAYATVKLLATPIPAFGSGPKGPAFLLPLFLQGLSLGSNLEKEQSALGLAEIVERTDPADALKPVVTQITGPLIRIVGERTAADVKAAIIYTLHKLLLAIPAFLKPFLPQLQRTFAKNLADQSSTAVRTRSAMALGTLIKLQTRIDPLAKEIIGGVRAAPDSGVRAAFLTALHEIVNHAGQHLSEPVRVSVAEVISDSESILGEDSGDTKQLALFAHIGADLVALPNDQEGQRRLVDSLINSKSKLQALLNANALYVHAPQATASVASDIESLFASCALSTSAVLSENGVSGLGKLALSADLSSLKAYEEHALRVLVSLVPKDEGRTTEVRRLSIVVLGAVSRAAGTPDVLKPYLDDLVPALFTSARDTLIPIKLAAEKTFLQVFDFVGRKDSALFDDWFAPAKPKLDARMQRSLPEYVRRVALRYATRDADEEDQQEGANEAEELREIWAVGLE